MSTASGLLGGHAYFLHWGVIQISLANLVVIAAMILLFVLALVLPFPGHHANPSAKSRPADEATERHPDEHAPSA